MQENKDKFSPIVDEFNAIQSAMTTQLKISLNALAQNYNILLDAFRKLEANVETLVTENESLRKDRESLLNEVDRLHEARGKEVEELR